MSHEDLLVTLDRNTKAKRELAYEQRKTQEELDRNTKIQEENRNNIEQLQNSVNALTRRAEESNRHIEEEATRTRVAQENIQREQEIQTQYAQYRYRFTTAQYRVEKFEEEYYSKYERYEDFRSLVDPFFTGNKNSVENKRTLLEEAKRMQNEDSEFLLPICMESLLEFELGNYEASKSAEEKSYKLHFKYATLFYATSYLIRGNKEKSWEAFNKYFEECSPFNLNQYHELLIELYLCDYYAEIDSSFFEKKLNDLIELYDSSPQRQDKLYNKIIYSGGVKDYYHYPPQLGAYDQNFSEISRIKYYNNIIHYLSEHLDYLKTIPSQAPNKDYKITNTITWLIWMPVNKDEQEKRHNLYYESSILDHGGNESLATGAPYNWIYQENNTDIVSILIKIYDIKDPNLEEFCVQKKIIQLLKKPCLRRLAEVCDEQRQTVDSVRTLKLTEFEQQIDLHDDLGDIKTVIKKTISKTKKISLTNIFYEILAFYLIGGTIYWILGQIFGTSDIVGYGFFAAYLFVRFKIANAKMENRIREDINRVQTCQNIFKSFEEEKNRISSISINVLEKLRKL